MTRMLDEMMAGSEVVLAYDDGVVAKCTRIPGGTVTAKVAPDVDTALNNLETALQDPHRRGTLSARLHAVRSPEEQRCTKCGETLDNCPVGGDTSGG